MNLTIKLGRKSAEMKKRSNNMTACITISTFCKLQENKEIFTTRENNYPNRYLLFFFL